MVNEYIRKEDAIRLAEQGQVQGFPWQFQTLVKLPAADVVEVVRCKDCKYWRSYWGRCYKHDEYGMAPDDFCSYGEKRNRRYE